MKSPLFIRCCSVVSLCAAFCQACGDTNSTGQPGGGVATGGGSAGTPGSAGSVSAGGANGGISGAGASGQPTAGAAGVGAGVTGGAAGAGGASGAAGAAGAAGEANGTSGASGTSGAGGAGGAGGAVQSQGTPLVYVGSSNGQISIFHLDAQAGKLSLVKSVSGGNSPSFLAVDPSVSHLYAANAGSAQVTSFAIDDETGDLTMLNAVASGGATPAHISVDHTGKYVMVANYDGGTTSIFPIAANGSLGASTDSESPGRQTHMISVDPTNHFVLVTNKGSDLISQFVFDATQGKLTPNSVPSVQTATGAGPRHFAFHPNGKFTYVIAETNSTMSAYSYDSTLGQLTFLQALSTLPAGTDASANTGAEVAVAPSGNFVYGSNRGNDSIVTYSVDASTGKLTFIGTIPSGGTVPRHFTLSTDGKLMLVANESGSIVSFSVNLTTGALTELLSVDAPKSPQFVGIVSLPSDKER